MPARGVVLDQQLRCSVEVVRIGQAIGLRLGEQEGRVGDHRAADQRDQRIIERHTVGALRLDQPAVEQRLLAAIQPCLDLLFAQASQRIDAEAVDGRGAHDGEDSE